MPHISPVSQPEPQLYKSLTPEEATAENDAIPFSTALIEAAPALRWAAGIVPPTARLAAIECLTAAVYYEGATEPVEGRRAIAQVGLNRVRHPAFPNTVCGVVYQGAERRTGCQFTFTCDGSLARRPSQPGWEAALKVATAALDGVVEPRVGMGLLTNASPAMGVLLTTSLRSYSTILKADRDRGELKLDASLGSPPGE